jgi:hypothetical protein
MWRYEKLTSLKRIIVSDGEWKIKKIINNEGYNEHEIIDKTCIRREIQYHWCKKRRNGNTWGKRQ